MATSPNHPMDAGQATSIHCRKAACGDRESIAWLVARLEPLLLAHATWRMGPDLRRTQDPSDIVHEAWLVLLPRLATLPVRDGRLTPVLLSYLTTTVLHKVRNLLRREIRRTAHLPTPSQLDGDPSTALVGDRSEVIGAVMRGEAIDLVRAALDELPDADRQIVLLRGIEQQAPEIVANQLGITRGAVSKRYRRALERLRSRLPGSVFGELQEE
ncbi:MAG: sigma-70 family RNA polymerase sigma factor [Planctomycetes bacterium]|nr:sigma-70 family RNA polymerase sigma factor [Planctomycetota bacterium]